MSPRQPGVGAGVDADGRPIVAELGRAETPQETADRKAEISRAHRTNQTTLNLVAALLACLAVVILVVLVVVRPATTQRPPVDYLQVASDAQESIGTTLVAPALPPSWSANRAELVTDAPDGIAAWSVGFVTPSTQYLAVDQGIDANPTWASKVLDGAPSTGSTTIDGIDWAVYDRRQASDPGNVAYALVTVVPASGDVPPSTIVLSGTASAAEFTTMASAVASEVAR